MERETMEIRELLLKRYGKFTDHRMVLKPGINIIYRGNETGKSTIHSFIKAMLFGLGRGRGKAAKTDEYQIRQPWDTPGAFLGSMRVEENGKLYRIDRCFDKSAPPLQVTCETTGAEAGDPQALLDELLGGISETAFTNTVFVPQAKCETDDALAQELRRYMVNSDSTMDGQLDVTQALQRLRKKKKAFEQRKKQEDEVLERQIEEKQGKAEQLRGELAALREQAGGPVSGRTGSRYEQKERPVKHQKNSTGKWILEFLLLLAGALALLGAYALEDWKLKLFLGIFGIVFLLMLLPIHFLIRPQEQELPEEEEELLEEEEVSPQLRAAMKSREDAYRQLQDELEQLYAAQVRPDGVETELAALTLAIDRICELSSGIYERSGGVLNQRASEILCELTEGAYDRIYLDETAEVRIHTPSRVLGLHQVSGGTMQQIYFALRMAAGELLCEGRQMPLILDEPFAMYDDRRLAAALRWLKKSGRQVILFTCQKREQQLLSEIDRGGLSAAR
jgi:DNA repair exonuclease SbcCD ATPase subunit